MKTLPYTISIRSDACPSEVQEVRCRRILRALPRRRETFEALWRDREVILKVFGHPWKARLHGRRESRGFQRLAQLGLAAPAVLCYGRTEDGRWAVVTEKVKDAASLLELLVAQGGPERPTSLLRLASGELARLHDCGVIQRDFHPGNFLIKGQRLIVLDPGQIRFLSRPVGRAASIGQLACLARFLAPDDRPEALDVLCTTYAKARQWQWGKADQSRFRRSFKRERRREIRWTGKRPLYKGRSNVRIKTRDGLAVAGKILSESGEFADLAASIEGRMNAGRVLRQDAFRCVARFDWAGHEIVATRFDEVGLLSTLGAIFRGSCARRRWVAARRLLLLRIPVAMPLGLIEKRRGPFRRRSYLLMRSVHGQPLGDWLCDESVSTTSKRRLVRQIFAVFERLAGHDITWGRLETKDIVVTDGGPVFTGFRGVVIHISPLQCRRRYRRETARFTHALETLGLDSEILAAAD